MSDALFPLPASDPDPLLVGTTGVLRATWGEHGLATAVYDAGEEYRFRLSRVWDPSGPRCVFVMLNPSTATEEVLDPTVTRCVGFARAWGFGALEVVNVFALRSTDPGALYTHADPIGAGNDAAIVDAACAGGLVVAAWGTHGALHGRGQQVREMLAGQGVALSVLRLTKGGFPGHPLYVPAVTPPEPWPLRA